MVYIINLKNIISCAKIFKENIIDRFVGKGLREVRFYGESRIM